MRTRGGEFLVKATDNKEIFTLMDLTEEQQMMRDMTRDFVDKEVWPHRDRFEKKDYDLTFELMKKAGELGLLGVGVPEAYGGMNLDFTSVMLVCDYISGASGSFSTAYGAHTGIGTLPIVLYGTEEQKKKYIPQLATGEWIGAYCLTEPGAGSDANSGKTKAVLSEDGKSYKISGQKMWISNAGYCNLMIVFARIEDDKNITGFIVEYDKDNPNGITLGEEEHKLGIRASSTRQVFFNDTVVPVENLLGERSGGFKIAMNALNVGRIKLGAACLEASRRVIKSAVNYANERVQFKTPISSFGAIQYKLGEMATRLFVSESASYRAGGDIEKAIQARVAKGESDQIAKLKGVEEYAIECAIIKVWVSDNLQYITDEGLQIYGGMGFSEEAPMEAPWRDCRIGRIYEGTNEINTLLTVSMMFRKAMKGHVDVLTPATAVGEEILGLPSFDMPDYSEAFSLEKEMIEKIKKTALMVAGKAAQTYGPDLENHQQLVQAAGKILIEIYMAESAVLVASKVHDQKGAETAKYYTEMAQLNLYGAVEKIEQLAKEAIMYMATGDEQKGMLSGLKRFSKYPIMPNIIALRESIAKKVIEENKYPFEELS